ncbi:PHB depolymerase family esterase [Pseudonocardia nematodicida]|uniref:PHB depolymerase family esterase n=1 Tax=Pseudonocardia nematodicida TaxID=1206997 RepID=A0ABV1K5J9_9PSEU
MPVIAAGCAAAGTPGGAPASSVIAGACDDGRGGGWRSVAVEFDGRSHDVDVLVPGTPADARPGLVLDLHASRMNGAEQAAISGRERVAGEHGVVVATPTGAVRSPDPTPPLEGGSWSWHVPGVPVLGDQEIPPGTRDDVDFLAEMITVPERRACVDPARVYATGYSGGARMASALACEIPERIAAVAPVAGLRAGAAEPGDLAEPDAATCRPGSPVSISAFHGALDEVNPYGGDDDPRWGYSFPAALERWARVNGCSPTARETPVDESITLVSHDDCAGGAVVQLHRITSDGRTWPGSARVACDGCGGQTGRLDATEVMAEFFDALR